MQEVKIPSGRQQLEGKLHLSEGRPGIVIAHSFRGNYYDKECAEAAQRFVQEGYSVLSFNFTGHGQSTDRLRYFSYNVAQNEVSVAVAYLNNLTRTNIGIYAVSVGTLAAAISGRAKTQVFLSPSPLVDPKSLLNRYQAEISEQEEELRTKGYATITSKSGRGNFNMGREWINEMNDWERNKVLGERWERFWNPQQIRPTPTLIIQGEKDSLTDLKTLWHLAGRRPSTKIYQIPEGDHNLTNPEHRKMAIDQASMWFTQRLR